MIGYFFFLPCPEIYIYIYREREREREIDIDIDIGYLDPSYQSGKLEIFKLVESKHLKKIC